MGNIEKSVKLTEYFVSLPASKYLLTAIILLGVIFGILINIGKLNGAELIFKGSMQGLFVLSAPAIISAVAIKILIYKIPFKRIVATTLIGEIIYAVTYGVGIFVATFNPESAKIVFLIGTALVFILWYMIARLVFILKWRSFIFAIIQLLFHLIFLFSSSIADFGTEPISAILKFYAAALVFLVAIYVFFMIINAPMRRNFGFNSTDAISMFAAQWLYQDKELEEAFESVGEIARVPVSIFGFEKGKERTFFVVPSVHYGPFGNLGGSEFSYLIAEEMKKRHGATAFVFHATATHDLNPSSSEELGKVMDAIEDIIKDAKFVSAKTSFLTGKKEECNSETLLFNDTAFVSLSRAPMVTEDINFGLGSMLCSEAEKIVKNATIIDQHNAETGEVTSFEPGSIVGYNYMEAIKEALNSKQTKSNLKIGVSQREINSPFVGKAGVKVAVFSSEPNTAMILLDSNGVTPEFREKLIGEAKKAGNQHKKDLHPIIFTTDTHQINSVRGVLNPLRDDEEVVKEMKTAVADAISNVSEAKFFYGKKWFDIKVLGAKQSIEIVTTVNSIVAVAKIAAPLILVGGIVAIASIIAKI